MTSVVPPPQQKPPKPPIQTMENARWQPLQKLAHGRVIKSFLPQNHLDKLPSYFQNLYIGDEIYLFESNGKWARGYIIVQPSPVDFIALATNMDKLPDQRIAVVILPLSNFKILETVDIPAIDKSAFLDSTGMKGFFSNPTTVSDVTGYAIDTKPLINESVAVIDHEIPTILDTEMKDTDNIDLKLHMKPSLPALMLSDSTLLAEIVPAILLLSSHIYSLYSVGEFSLSLKLSSMYYELNELRIKLTYNLCTKSEKRITRQTVSSLLSQTAKLLSSNHTNHNKIDAHGLIKYDTAGYEAILARDPETAELFDYSSNDIKKDAAPDFIANNQLMYALASNYPIGDVHISNVQRNNQFHDELPSQLLVDYKGLVSSSSTFPKGFVGMNAYIYFRTTREVLTETFQISIKQDHKNDLTVNDKITAALFKNISNKDVTKGRIYLVVVLTEDIETHDEFSQKSSAKLSSIRKGVAAGVTDISRVFNKKKKKGCSSESLDFKIKLFGSYLSQSSTDGNFGWGDLTNRIIKGSSKGVAINPRADHIILSIREIQSSSAEYDSLTQLPSIRAIAYNPLVKNIERYYISIGKVHLKYTNTGIGYKNLPITIQVSSNNPDISFNSGSNEPELKKWQFPSVHSNEAIGEMMKVNGIGSGSNGKMLSTSENDFLNFHAFINGELVGDGKLLIRRSKQVIEYKKTNLIELVGPNSNQSIIISFEITTNYVGKRFNIDHSCNTLLNWKSLLPLPGNEENFVQLLEKFNKLQVQDIVKYFPDLLTALLEAYKVTMDLNSPLNTVIFESIVHLLDMLFAKTQTSYHSLFDSYIKSPHKLSFIGWDLLTKLGSYFDNYQGSWDAVNRSICRVATLLLRLAIKTTDLNNNISVENLKSSSQNLIYSLIKFLKAKGDKYAADQSRVLDSVDFWLNTLKSIFGEFESLEFGIEIINSVGIRGLSSNEEKSANDSASLSTTMSANNLDKRNDKVYGFIITKLLLIRRLLHTGWIIKNNRCRDRFIFTSIGWALEVLRMYSDVEASRLANGIFVSICGICWDLIKSEQTDQFYLCRGVVKTLPIVADIAVHYHKFSKSKGLFKPKRTFNGLFPVEYPFLEHTMDSIVNDEIFVEIIIELMTLFAYLTKIGKYVCGEHGLKSLYAQTDDDRKADILLEFKIYDKQTISKDEVISIIHCCKLMVQSKCYPASKWLSLHALLIESGITAFEMLRDIMIDDYIPSVSNADSFDRSLWGNYLKTALKFATAMPSSICHLADIPRIGCWKISGDVRGRTALLVNKVWDALAWDALSDDIDRFQLKKFGGYQVEFINYDYGVLQDVMLFSLQRHVNCQEVGVKMLWTIIISEWLLNERLIDIERECIVGLYEIFHSNKYKPFQFEERVFIRQLKSLIRIDPEDEAYEAIDSFIQNIYEFLEVLNDLENVPPGLEFDDDRTFHKLNINGFLKHVNKPELLHSFISEMVEFNIAKQNFVQAGLLLELLASTYDWITEDLLPACVKPKLPEQSSFERKETLMKMMADNFVKGQALEKAIEVYKQLAQVYDTIKYDFKGLSFVHSVLLKLYLALETVERLTPSYFRIAFIGYGFPNSVRGRQYIYEGYPFEHITSIHDRLLRLHPGAVIVSDDDEAKNLSENVPTGRYLHISTVEPRVNIPQNISHLTASARLYIENRHLTRFTNARRLPGSTSVMDLWVEETTYETYTSFPTLMNRSEIKSAVTVKLSPLQNALRSLTSKTQELIGLETMANKAIKEKEDLGNIFSELSRQLSGTIDAPVNGGIGQYRVFFDNDTFTENPAYSLQLEALTIQFNELALTIRRCLIIHAKLVPKSMQESQFTLVDLFKKNFQEEIKRNNIETDDVNSQISSNAVVLVATPAISLRSNVNAKTPSTNEAASSSNGSLRRVNTTGSEESQKTESISSRINNIYGHRSVGKRSVLNWRQSRTVLPE